MAAASYTTDLTEIADWEPAGGDVATEPAGATMGVPTSDDTDNFIQGARCASKTTAASGAPAFAGLGVQDAGPHTINSPNAFYCWVFVGGGGLIGTLAQGGIQLLIGQDLNNYRYWSVDGNEYFPYIGWQCIAIETDNAVVAATGSQGTPSATKQFFGARWYCLINIGKGNPMAIDAMRWGRTITITGGTSPDSPATFAGIAGQNDALANRWGQFQAVAGGYQLQGKLAMGTSGAAVDLRDSNVNIVTAVSRKVAASFNAIEIQNASSRVDWDAVSWAALGTVSRGTFTVTDNADVNITGCSFTGLSTFSLLANTDILDSTFRQCDTVTAPGSNLSGSQFLLPRVAADTGAVIWNVASDPDGNLDNCTFSKGTNAHHAIQFGTSAPHGGNEMTLRGITFTGFDTTDGSTSANDAVLYFPDTGGDTTWTINLVGCSGTISYKKARAGDTVNRIVDPVTLTVHVQDSETGTAIEGARVYVTAAAGGPLAEGTVLINDVTGTDPYTDVTDTRTLASDQPITGWVRKASSPGPYYRTGPVAGSFDSSNGLTVTVQMIEDA